MTLDDDGDRRFVPLEHDVLRLFEPRITAMPRDGRWPKCLRVESELGESWDDLVGLKSPHAADQRRHVAGECRAVRGIALEIDQEHAGVPQQAEEFRLVFA